MALAPSNWCIKVAEKVYGPYTDQQMEAFATEGRLAPRSNVSPAGGTTWREAHNYSSLARLFEKGPKASGPTFGKAGNDDNAHTIPDGAPATIVIIFDTVSATAGRLENEIRALGDGFRITDNVWCITTTLSAVGVKNALVPRLSSREFVYVADTSRGRATWHNTTPEVHARLTRASVKITA